MALILLAFIGTLAVFLRVWRELEALRASVRELKDSLQFYAVDAAQQNRDMAAAFREGRGSEDAPGKKSARPEEDCLSHLLEYGLPNLLDGGASASPATPSGHEEDENRIRRAGGSERERART